MSGEFTDYLRSLSSQLRLGPQEEQEILREVQAHLEDKAAELEAQGIPTDEASGTGHAPDGRTQRSGPEHVCRPQPRCLEGCPPCDGSPLPAGLPICPPSLEPLLPGRAAADWRHTGLLAELAVLGIPANGPIPGWVYTLAAPALSWLLALVALAYGGWTLVTTGKLPFNVILFFLLIGYVPFSMWIMFSVVRKLVRQDWLLASLTALPFPFLTSWVLFLNWAGGTLE